jgi:hypothetical protein
MKWPFIDDSLLDYIIKLRSKIYWRRSVMFGVMNHLNVSVCEDAEDAVEQGFIYHGETYAPIEIEKVVVVKNGTANGHSTVDFVLCDEKGNKFVVMVTGNLLKMLPL